MYANSRALMQGSLANLQTSSNWQISDKGLWENLLGDGFLRIHRAFLVNVAESVLSSPDAVEIAGKVLPVSRKYKDNVKAILAAAPQHPCGDDIARFSH